MSNYQKEIISTARRVKDLDINDLSHRILLNMNLGYLQAFFKLMDAEEESVDFSCASCARPNDSNNLESKYCLECQRDRDLSAAEALEDR